MRFYCATRRVFPRHYILRIFLLCFVSVHLPILAFAGTMAWLGTWSWAVFWPILLATVLGTGAAILGMAGLLKPIAIATEQLRRVQRGEMVERIPEGGPDMAGQLLAAVELAAQATRERVEKVRSLAGSDPLTGLRNRRGLNESLQAVLASGGSGTIAVLDCDRFKQVNDTLGHAAGDRALRAIAGGIRAHTREADTAARWGGDEFVIYFADLDPDAAGQVLVRIRDALHRQPAALIDDRPLGFSFGLARLGGAQGHRDSNSAFDAADRDLYRAKQACRGAIPA